ncbi:hypothetical protein EYF80_039637 [Liparis tanakae]|uniref:Uncharacterized protein n=1 Tax=Liparis tanakae TaxID=230148 RepID=A0A4Z2G9G6_9TELE|nr:hypothetical protein EYF80_039637 [Liparis tanakae]
MADEGLVPGARLLSPGPISYPRGIDTRATEPPGARGRCLHHAGSAQQQQEEEEEQEEEQEEEEEEEEEEEGDLLCSQLFGPGLS